MNPRIAAVAAAYAEGLTTRQAAARLGITPNTVRRYATQARSEGTPVPRPNLKRDGPAKLAEIARLYRLRWTVEAIAQRVGVSPRSVQTYAGRLRRREGLDLPRAPASWCPPARIKLGECCRPHAEGWTQAALAERYGVTRNAISRALNDGARAGIPTGPLGRWPKP